MTTPASGAIRLREHIKTEWGGPDNLKAYYRGGSYVPSNYYTTGNVPTSGDIKLSNFYGTTAEHNDQDFLCNA